MSREDLIKKKFDELKEKKKCGFISLISGRQP